MTPGSEDSDMMNRKLAVHPLHALLSGTFARATAGVLGTATPLLALANPTGGQVVGGSATIHNVGPNGTVINQASQNAIINWQQFNVGANQYVQFVQPNSSSVVLNRVIGGNASQIFGDIRANGQVFLVNSNGIYFAPGASLDAQGVVASTLDIDNSDFMAGRYVFSKAAGSDSAGVDNQGQIHVGRGGYVVLAGDYAQNQGSIDAQFGKVYLAAGNAATLTLDGQQLISYTVDSATLSRLAGVNNSGEITALGGSVVMTADVANALTATAVNNTGVISARSVSDHGGEIVLEATGGDIYNSGKLDASAAQAGVAGGTVVLHADGRTELAPASNIDTSGDGAKGGFIDLSGHDLRVRGFVTAGKGGEILLDPANINIIAGNVSGAGAGATNSVGTGFIEGKLDAGSNVTILASNQIKNTTGTDITATGSGNLTLVIGGGGGSSCGANGICVGHGSASVGHLQGTIDLNSNPLPINIGGKLSIDAAGNANSGGVVSTVGLKGSSVTVTAGNITVTGNITATAGDVILGGHSGNADSLTVTGTVTANNGAFKASFSNEGGAGIGTVNLHGVTAQGISVMASHINVTGTLHAKGSGEAAASHQDVVLLSQHEFSSGGGAGINVSGDVISDHGSVNITASGHTTAGASNAVGTINVGGSINAARDVNISASNNGGFHNFITTGNITAGGAVSVNYQGGGASSGTTVKVGNVDTQHSMSFSINDTSTGNLVVKAGTLTNHQGSTSNGNGIRVSLTGANPHFQAAAISNLAKSGQSCECSAGDIRVKLDSANGSHALLKVTGAIKSSHGNVTLGSSDSAVVGTIAVNDVSGRNVSMYGNVISFGNVTAANSVTILDNTTANSAAITATPGTTISARHIDIEMSASYGGTITLANLSAQNPNGPASIFVSAQSFNDPVSVIVNGNINVSGKGANSGFSSAMPGLGVPVAASLTLEALGSNESGPAQAHLVKVTGNITMNGVAGNFNVNRTACSVSCGSVGPHPGFTATGVGGMVTMDVTAEGSLGSAQLLGTTTLKGTDAELRVSANTIKTGALNVAASGHTMALSMNGSFGTGSSKNSVGRADIFLQNGPNISSSAAANITVGNVTVSGKGSATVGMDGKHVTVGNITVTATAAKGKRSGNLHGDGLGNQLPGLMGIPLEAGAYNAGKAGVFIGASDGRSGSHHPSESLTINAGNVTVNGVGEADINLAGKAIVTKNLTATATKGSMHGSFASGEAGGTASFNIQGGEAHIGLDGSSGGNINVAGAIAASGPTAGVDIRGTAIKVSGGVSAVASGGTDVTDFRRGTSSHTHFSGPGDITGVNIGGLNSAASVNIGGTVKVKGPGLVGVMITGHKVTLGGLSASASAARKYTVLDTGNSINATDSFTLGDVAILVFQGSGGAVTGAATVTGNVNLNAPHGNIFLGTQLNVKGQVALNANGDISTNIPGIAPRFNEISHAVGHGSSGSGVPSSFSLPLKLNAAGVSMLAGGDIDMSGATIKGTGVTALKAGGNIVLSGVTIDVGTFVAYAGGTIHNGGTVGSISAAAVAFRAGKDLTLSSTDITVGAGVVAQDAATVNGNAALKAALADPAFAATLAGDPQLAAGFAAGGIVTSSVAPNAAFIGGGLVSLGNVTLKGGYLYLQGSSVSLGGTMTTPKGLVVQVAPASPTGTTDLEGQGAKGADLNLNDSDFLGLFGDGATLVLGASGQTGDISLGNNGSFDIGSDNLIVDTTGNVTGLGNVTSTGIVSSLESLLGSLVVPPTSSEIDPTSVNNNNAAGDKKHQNHNGETEGSNSAQGGTISQDTSASSACH
jgi:filamentous hemagglutinin family protein